MDVDIKLRQSDSTIMEMGTVGQTTAATRDQRAFNLVCNAQPFGGGPGATLRAVLPRLRERLRSWGPAKLHFVGSGLTMEFQQLQAKKVTGSAGWDQFHDIDLYTNVKQGKKELVTLLGHLQPRLVLTAMDEAFAAIALEAGCRVVVIDLLLWWWPVMPTRWRDVHLLIAADFYGVRERIARERLTNTVTVPPLGPPPAAAQTEASPPRDKVLLNFGGMLNTLAPDKDYVEYAFLMYSLARQAIDRRNAALPKAESATLAVLVASPAVSAHINVLSPGAARTVLPNEALEIMSTAQLVCCTPGLGNLCAAAAIADTVMLLPPLQETQALQSHLVRQAGIEIDAVEWHELIGGERIQYQDRPTLDIMAETREAQRKLIESPQARDLMVGRLFEAMMKGAAMVRGEVTARSPLRQLIETFGHDNGDRMAAEVVNALGEYSSG